MLIEVFDDVLKKALKTSDKDNERAVETLRQLAWSIRKNHHLVYFPGLDQKTINDLGKILGQKETRALELSFSKRNDLKKIRGLLNFRVEVSFEKPSGKNANVIQINPGGDNKFELFEECHILTENLLDAEFYKYFATAYQKSNNINCNLFKTYYYPLQGGGATIKQVFILECERGQHLCLAILDSDKKWPNFIGFGQTAKEFEDKYVEYKDKRGVPIACHYYVMQQTNEIENLIPIEILNHFSSSEQKKFLISHSSVLPWLDMKKGLEYRILYNDNAYKEWKRALPLTVEWNRISNIKKSCGDEKDFKNKVDALGLKPVVQNWGSDILEKILNPDVKRRNKYDLKNIGLNRLSQAQRQEWNAIGELVFNWCCCFAKTTF